jgi:hypothetical protein
MLVLLAERERKMLGLGKRLFVAVLVILASTFALAQSSHEDEVLGVLRGALKCPLPQEEFEDTGQPHLTIQSYAGDARTIAITGQSLYWPETKKGTAGGFTVSRFGPLEIKGEQFSVTAKLSDIGVVEIGEYSPVGSSKPPRYIVTLVCSEKRDCLQKFEEGFFYYRGDCLHSGCSGRIQEPPNAHAIGAYDIRLCDHEAANLAKIALEELIRINTTAAPLSPAARP